MRVTFLTQKTPDVSLDQKEMAEAVKLIRKLRWIGKADEARTVECQLRRTALADRAGMTAEPFGAD